MDDKGRNEFEEILKTLDSARIEGRQQTFRMPFTALSFGLSVTSADDIHWPEELIRSAVQMDQGKCGRWLVVQLANKISYAISKIEIILPGRFSDAELISGKYHLEEKTQQTIIAKKPGRNDPCPCGSGKKYKKCHGLNN